MPGQSFTTKPREGEWDSFLLQVERLGREAHSLQQQTISRSTKIADIATSGTMGAFLRKERSRIPEFVRKLHETPEAFAIQVGHETSGRVMNAKGYRDDVDIYSIRYAGQKARTMTIRLGKDFTEISLSE